jgi:hypothetical protein
VDVRIVALAAQSILAAARSHKRAAAMHKRQAADLMRQFDQLRQLAERDGITLVLDEITQTPKEGSHGE